MIRILGAIKTARRTSRRIEDKRIKPLKQENKNFTENVIITFKRDHGRKNMLSSTIYEKKLDEKNSLKIFKKDQDREDNGKKVQQSEN